MSFAAADPTAHSAYRLGALALLMAAGAIVIALGFEHIGGYVPCELCLKERYAYYAGVPLLFAALVLLSAAQSRAAAALFAVVGLAFLANAALGTYHAGAEWGFWLGPQACSGQQALTTSAGGLLDALQHTSVVRCDVASWRFAGLSFAGWDVVASVLIAFLSLRAAGEALRAR
ncbi:MAG: disulfide bond formation protein B [Hyphomicrobium sp.]